MQDPNGDKLVIKKGSDDQTPPSATATAPPPEPLHSAAQDRQQDPGSGAAHAHGGGDMVDVTLNPRGGSQQGQASTALHLTSAPGGQSQASAGYDDIGSNGRPVVRYNPFGADARADATAGSEPGGQAKQAAGEKGGGTQAVEGETASALHSDKAKRPEVSPALMHCMAPHRS